MWQLTVVFPIMVLVSHVTQALQQKNRVMMGLDGLAIPRKNWLQAGKRMSVQGIPGYMGRVTKGKQNCR